MVEFSIEQAFRLKPCGRPHLGFSGNAQFVVHDLNHAHPNDERKIE